MAEITRDIEATFGTIGTSAGGWDKTLNLISWNGGKAKYDLRDWAPDGDKCGKGLTMTKAEVIALRDLLNTMELD